jgi:hypothetical protein
MTVRSCVCLDIYVFVCACVFVCVVCVFYGDGEDLVLDPTGYI